MKLTSSILKQLQPESKLLPPHFTSFTEMALYVEKSDVVNAGNEDISGTHRTYYDGISLNDVFLEFLNEKGDAEEDHFEVTCLLQGSVVNASSESFELPGVYRIQNKKISFVIFTLPVVRLDKDVLDSGSYVSDEQADAYMEFREEWKEFAMAARMGDNAVISINDSSFDLDREYTWDELFLPEELKESIKESVEGWLKNEEFFKENNLPWKRGIILHGEPGCGKTSLIKTLISNYDFQTITFTGRGDCNDYVVSEAFGMASDFSPALVFIEEIDALFHESQCSVSHFQSVIDGIQGMGGVFIIATTNHLNRLPETLTDRPSRFDRKFEIPTPDLEMSQKYLAKFFTEVSVDKIKEMAEKTVKAKLSYAYLKDLYISSSFYALQSGRKIASEADIEKAMVQILKDKKVAKKSNVVKSIGV